MALSAICSHVSAIVITQVGTTYSENFDTLASSGTSSLMPAYWSFLESGTSGNTTYGAGTGSSNTGNTYSFGATNSSERALGALQSGTLASLFGVHISNGTGGLISTLSVGYFGEQWKLGATARVDRLDFEYSLDATSLSTGNWLGFDSLDFTAPTTAGTPGALDGNDAANRQAIASVITGLSLIDGASMWLRWVDFNAAGSDDGLAIDDFGVVAIRTVTAPGNAVPDSLPMATVFGGVLAGLALIRRHVSTVGCIAA